MKALLIEDAKAYSELIIEYIGLSDNKNVQVDVSVTLKDGISKALKSEYDMIMVDLNLPDSEGISTFKEILKCKKNFNNQNTKIIVLTGTEGYVLGKQIMKLGADDFITKDDCKEEDINRVVKFASAFNDKFVKKATKKYGIL